MTIKTLSNVGLGPIKKRRILKLENLCKSIEIIEIKKITNDVQSHATSLSGLVGARSTRPLWWFREFQLEIFWPNSEDLSLTSLCFLPRYSSSFLCFLSSITNLSPLSSLSPLTSPPPRCHRRRWRRLVFSTTKRIHTSHTHPLHTHHKQQSPYPIFTSLFPLFLLYPTPLQPPTKPTTIVGLRGRGGLLPLRPSPLNQQLQPI